MTMHMDSARSEPTHYNTVQFGDQITVTEITTFGSSLRGNLTFTGGYRSNALGEWPMTLSTHGTLWDGTPPPQPKHGAGEAIFHISVPSSAHTYVRDKRHRRRMSV